MFNNLKNTKNLFINHRKKSFALSTSKLKPCTRGRETLNLLTDVDSSTDTKSHIFKASALWANAFYKLICPYVCLFVCLSVCLSVHF